MPDPQCYQVIQLCGLRAARLDPAGAPLVGADNMYVTDSTIELGIAPQVTEGDTQTQLNGCGAICATLSNPDRLSRVDLSLSLCQLDSELIELLTGGTLVVDGTGNTIGYELPGPSDDVGANGVSVEAWAKAWEEDSQAVNADIAAGPLYFHFVFPRVRWVLNGFTVGAGFATIPLGGKAGTNPQFGNGPANDLPHAFTKLGGWFFDDELPVASCGYVAVPAAAS